MKKELSLLYCFALLTVTCIGAAAPTEMWSADKSILTITEMELTGGDRYVIDYLFDESRTTAHAVHNLDIYDVPEENVVRFALDLIRTQLRTLTRGARITEIDVILVDKFTQYQFNQKSGGALTYEKVDLVTGTKTPQPLTAEKVEKLLSGPCRCAIDYYDCSDFRTWPEAQECYTYCNTQLPKKDVHNLDPSKRGSACAGVKF